MPFEKFSNKPFKLPRENVIEGAKRKCDPDEPFTVISRDKDGEIYVASTGPATETMDLLEEASLFIENNAVDDDASEASES